MKMEAHRTPIQSFYAGQTIFITGGTGFLGKILIEKLLRSCPDISTIYILIRSKKDKNPERRLDEMFDSVLFDRVKNEVPHFRKKVVPIVGDLEIENLGLSKNDKNILIHKVSIIFHMAANVRFIEKLKHHVQVNICATNTILSIVKLMQNLKSFIYVSTIYSNFNMKHVEERVYTYPIDYKDIISFVHTLSENEMEEKMTKIVSQWPNTYTFTKAMAERLLRDEGQGLPIGIFRPGTVSTTANEPLIGWTDNKYGPVGVAASMLLGITRVQRCNSNAKTNLVPVDFTINALIASAWDIFNQCRKDKDMLIYNFVSPIDRPTWSEYTNALLDTSKIYPMHKAIYFPCMTFLQRDIPYKICVWLYHFLPALLMDAANICMNRQPRMLKLYMTIGKCSKAIEPFCNYEWSYSTDNVQAMWDHLGEEDQNLFKFSMFAFDWTKYLVDHYKGIRLFLLKDDDSTLEISRIKHKRFYWIHQTLRMVFIFIIFWIIWLLVTIMYV
ncbi:PREDICTED: putative fatty acyl-CoA reductase CG5065 isoform X2 [Vollenhovia emeryi]|uniref:putative fatty acyl-CoA reductase CG5065 isoform X2 n=1 Tax=Vollenhovia emeryi TaxID=411798 RepID=UPI0005F481D3|nr:PREDICTED: putative fatty acyl-CoA reductase CG5065 isoform X2 [Vollenhovia emeryi]